MAKKRATKEWEQAVQHVLRAARVERGFTQRQLSQLLGKPANMINLIETGNRDCTLTEFLQICETLSVEPTEIVGRMVRW